MDVIALGELLVDFTDSGIDANGIRLFQQNPGGAPANVLVALAKLGRSAAFIGKVGDDMHGRFLRETLVKENIDIQGLRLDDSVFTTLAFVALNDKGERSFSFSRKPGADTCLSIDEIKLDLIKQARIFHFGSLSLTNEPSRGATLYAIQKAREYGLLISYDPNYRPLLWENEQAARIGMRLVLELEDIIKLSEEEIELVTGFANIEEASQFLFQQGVKAVAVTCGDKGAHLLTKKYSCFVQGYKSNCVDTTGAGDSFWGGILNQLLLLNKELEQINKEEWEECLRFGNAVASLCIEKRVQSLQCLH